MARFIADIRYKALVLLFAIILVREIFAFQLINFEFETKLVVRELPQTLVIGTNTLSTHSSFYSFSLTTFSLILQQRQSCLFELER